MTMVNRTSLVSSARALDIQGLLGILTLSGLSVWGVLELFRSGAHRFHLLGVFVALFLSGSTFLTIHFFASRAALSKARLAHERLSLSMAVGHSAIWDLNVKTGQEVWFGDLRTLLGIPCDSLSAPGEDFYRYLHPEDRQHVSEVVTEAREKRSPYAVEFRSVHADGTVRWISAAGEFQYTKRGDPERMLGIAIDITDRKLAERALLSSEEKFSRVFRESPVALTLTSTRDHRYLDVNVTFEEATGWRREEVVGRTPFDINIWANPAERKKLAKTVLEGKAVRDFEVRYRRKDGSQGVGLASADLMEIGGQPCILSAIVDITDRDRAEHALRESEERFRLVANTAPVMIWMSGTDKLCNYFNRPWLEFTGRSLQSELGNGWADGLHPEDMSACLRTYTEAFDQHRSFEMQYRLRRHDGQYRWLLDIGVPRFNADGSFAGYIGSCLDITERKQAEEAMASIGRRLIEAHEEERTRIGRELHDDINQRLALLAVELDRWKEMLPSGPQLREYIRRAQKRIHEIAKDVQSLSHRLHASKLDYLGLPTAANSFCRELSENSGVNVMYNHSGVPRTIPKEVSLCLFRVLQEALQNAIKHSGVKEFKVDLRGTSEAVELTVIDAGSGFDEQEAFTRQGLGLVSMRERLQLVHGELSVESDRGVGTTIRARVPLSPNQLQELAG